MTGETERKLKDIMKVELLQDKSIDEIKHIWLEYHKQKAVLVATIPTNVYEMQMKRGKEHPLFIFPLPRSEGFEFFLAQFALNTVHFTPLLCYQVRSHYNWIKSGRQKYEIFFRCTRKMHRNA